MYSFGRARPRSRSTSTVKSRPMSTSRSTVSKPTSRLSQVRARGQRVQDNVRRVSNRARTSAVKQARKLKTRVSRNPKTYAALATLAATGAVLSNKQRRNAIADRLPKAYSQIQKPVALGRSLSDRFRNSNFHRRISGNKKVDGHAINANIMDQIRAGKGQRQGRGQVGKMINFFERGGR